MNITLLRKVQAQILAKPELFDMCLYFIEHNSATPECGSTACIAGWALTLDADLKWPSAYHVLPRNDPYKKAATKVLKLTRLQASRLFYTRDWPEPFHTDYVNLDQTIPISVKGCEEKCIKKAKLTARYIDFFIETKGRRGRRKKP